jgi:hypothetical protein
MLGNRALYRDGWIAVCRHGRLPWMNQGTYDVADDKWELYNLDFSEANDLAAANPQKLHDLQDIFWAEAAKYNILPLNDRFAERGDPSLRPSLIEGRTHFTYFAGAERIPESSSPNIKNKSHIITAFIDQSGDGVLVAAGGTVGGYTLFVKGGKPTYEYNWRHQFRAPASRQEHVRVEFKYDGGGLSKGGAVTMFLNDKKVADGRVDQTIFARFSADETLDTGLDTGSPVSDQYASPFKFTGAINRGEVDIAPTKFGALEQERIREALRAAAHAEE